MKGPPVVVVGLDCPTGLQTARTFAARGVEVIGVAADPKRPSARTRACARVIAAGPEPEEIVQALLGLGRERADRPVLIPCTDLAVLSISQHRDELAVHYRMSMPGPDVIEVLLDKARFAEFARERGLPIPDTRVVRSRAELAEAAGSITYPCVLKPAVKSVEWRAHARAKALIADSSEELAALYEQHAHLVGAFVVQAWIEGGDTDHYTCDCYLGKDGEPLVTFTTRKLRQWPPVVGQGCLSVEHDNPAVRDFAVNTLLAAGHRGQGYLEMKHDAATGRYLIIEANVGRPTGRSAAAEAAGVELLMTVYADLVGHKLPRWRQQRFRGVKWIHLRRDVRACVSLWLERRITVAEILRSWRGPLTFALFSPSDPVPFFADLWRSARAALARRRPAPKRPVAPEPRPDEPPRSNAVTERTSVNGRAPAPPSAAVVDFDVHGIVGVRVLDARPDDLEAVIRDLGQPGSLRSRTPDVIVCFADELTPGDLRLIDGERAAYADDGVYVLDSPGGPPVARVKRGKGWGQGLIVCRRGARTVPTLAASVDMAALAKGWVGLHASAWITGGVGVVAAGWPHSGKTGALLAACARGATPIGDDRIFLSTDGRSMAGLSRPIVGKDWHFAQLSFPQLGLGSVRRALMAAAPALDGVATRWSTEGRLGLLDRPVRGVVRGIRRSLRVEVKPDSIAPGRVSGVARPDVLLLLETHRESSIVSERVEPRVAAGRLAAQVEAELMPVLRTSLAFEYAGRPTWGGAKAAPGLAERMLRQATGGLQAFVVRHPYPCSLDALHAEIDSLVLSPKPTRVSSPVVEPIDRVAAAHSGAVG